MFQQTRTTACKMSSAIGNIQTYFCLKKVKSSTLMCKLSNQAPSICIRDLGTPLRRSRQHSIARINKYYGEDDILQRWMGCGVLMRSIHKVIRTQGIPVNAIIKVCNGECFLVRRYGRTASVNRSGDHCHRSWATNRKVHLTFYMSAGRYAS
jgi:hypothetical protein